jgi:hypothetical protein
MSDHHSPPRQRLLIVLGLLALIGALAVILWKRSQNAAAKLGQVQPGLNRSAAIVALKDHPEVEFVAMDDAKGELRLRIKSTNEEVSLSYEEVLKGNLNFNEVVTRAGVVAAKSAPTQSKVGLSDIAPPPWVPSYPGLRPLVGSNRETKNGIVSGVLVGQHTDTPDTAKDFYLSVLAKAGYEIDASPEPALGSQARVLKAQNGKLRTQVKVVITSVEVGCEVILNYEGRE